MFSPNINVATKVDITGKIDIDKLKAAIRDAVKANEILNCRIVLLENGDAVYEKMEEPAYNIEESNIDWTELIMKNQALRFKLEIGELIRFFIIVDENNLQLLIIAHHLAGDGLSFSYLVEDMMKAMKGEKLKYKPLCVQNGNDLPKDSGFNPVVKLLLDKMNKAWNKLNKAFSYSDSDEIFHKYWSTRKTIILCEQLNEQEYKKINDNAKLRNISINSLITTALIEAYGEKADVGLAVNIRDKGNTGMGNYASGVSVLYSYNKNLSFFQNAQIVHRRIYKKLDNPKRKYLVVQFMDSMAGTFIDSAAMASYGGYDNKISRKLVRLMSYDKPKDISLTNLTKLNIPQNYGEFEIKNYSFVAPLIPNALRVIGVASLGGCINLTMHAYDDKNLEKEKKFFYETIKILKGTF